MLNKDNLSTILKDIKNFDLIKPSQYIALNIYSKGYYNNRLNKEELVKFLSLKPINDEESEIYLGHTKPFISGIMYNFNNTLILSNINSIYLKSFINNNILTLDDLINNLDLEDVFEILENTFNNYLIINDVDKIEDINGNQSVIKLASNEYIIISENPVRIFKSTKRVLKTEVDFDKVRDKLKII